jgi:hypothetical protein
MPRFILALVLIIQIANLASCKPTPRATFNSRSDLANAAPVTRLLVIEALKTRAFTMDMHKGFQAALASRLYSCGVFSNLLHIDSLDLDPEQRIAQIQQEFHPGTVMSMRTVGGSDLAIGAKGGYGSLIIELNLVEVASSRVIWQARTLLPISTEERGNDDAGAGGDFATSVVAQLRDDGVLQGCPAPAVWKRMACLERRQRTLQATRGGVPYERMKSRDTLEHCE